MGRGTRARHDCGGRRTWPGRMRSGSGPMTSALTDHHACTAVAISAFEGGRPEAARRSVAMSQRQSPRTTTCVSADCSAGQSGTAVVVTAAARTGRAPPPRRGEQDGERDADAEGQCRAVAGRSRQQPAQQRPGSRSDVSRQDGRGGEEQTQRSPRPDAPGREAGDRHEQAIGSRDVDRLLGVPDRAEQRTRIGSQPAEEECRSSHDGAGEHQTA